MENLLRKLNGDKSTKEALQQYLTDIIAEEGVRLMFDKKDVSHIADAKMLIDKAFEQLSIDYGVPEKKPEQTNIAR
jgi:hypothetical protein